MFVKFGDNPKQNFLIKFKLQDEALRIINFLPNTALVSEICKTSKILKPSDYKHFAFVEEADRKSHGIDSIR